MQIPFSSIRSFVDPSVEFGLTFESQNDGKTTQNGNIKISATDEKESKSDDTVNKGGEVVSLESFRKS